MRSQPPRRLGAWPSTSAVTKYSPASIASHFRAAHLFLSRRNPPVPSWSDVNVARANTAERFSSSLAALHPDAQRPRDEVETTTMLRDGVPLILLPTTAPRRARAALRVGPCPRSPGTRR